MLNTIFTFQLLLEGFPYKLWPNKFKPCKGTGIQFPLLIYPNRSKTEQSINIYCYFYTNIYVFFVKTYKFSFHNFLHKQSVWLILKTPFASQSK